jgi:WD40 repeat protein
LLRGRKGLPDGRVRAVAFPPDGLFLAAASFEVAASVWDADTGERLYTLSGLGEHTRGRLLSCSPVPGRLW